MSKDELLKLAKNTENIHHWQQQFNQN